MMKYLLTTLSLISVTCFAQKSEVVTVDSAFKKSDLYSKSLTWVAKTWKEANEVVQAKDESTGTIVVKGGLVSKPKSLGIPAKGLTMTTVTIRVKDGKAKIDFEETFFKWEIGTVWTIADEKKNGQYRNWKEDVLAEMDNLIKEYKLALEKKVDDF